MSTRKSWKIWRTELLLVHMPARLPEKIQMDKQETVCENTHFQTELCYSSRYVFVHLLCTFQGMCSCSCVFQNTGMYAFMYLCIVKGTHLCIYLCVIQGIAFLPFDNDHRSTGVKMSLLLVEWDMSSAVCLVAANEDKLKHICNCQVN